MPKFTYQLNQPVTIDGKILAKGDVIATVETPDGVPVDRALNAIAKNLASPPDAPAAEKA